jgi:branched-chain amino acid transport system substrate-binding protein
MNQISFGSQHRKGREEQIKRQSRDIICHAPQRWFLPFHFRLLHFAFCLLTCSYELVLRSLPFAFPACLLGLFSVPCFAQEPKPYAAINREAVNYHGPGRDAQHDLAGPEIRIGLLAPLAGPRQAEGEDLRRAAAMAIDDVNAASPRGSRPLTLVTRDESGPWGQASSEIVHMVFDDQAVALITSAEGGAAHLAEQVANKIGVPVLTLSTDPTTTQINLPWIFRLGPSDAAQAQAFARDIYRVRGFGRVALITQDDHDGRVGGEAFEKAVREMNARAPARLVVRFDKTPVEGLVKALRDAQAVVIWADGVTAGELVRQVREAMPSAPLYLCRKAAQNHGSSLNQSGCRSCGNEDAGTWIAGATGDSSIQAGFAEHYRLRFGVEPGIGAAEAYDAVRVLAASLGQSGPNRTRLRDVLAGVSGFPGASGVISFDHAGNDLTVFPLTRLP